MVLDLKLTRFDNVPWGFRLIGGSDFELPLTVVMVKEGSIAEQQGLKVGDVIVRINDESTSPLTHAEAHVVISNCGNQFFFGIHREDSLEDGQCSMEFIPIYSPPRSPLPEHLFEPINSSPEIVVEEVIEDKNDLVEEEIAAVLSGEAEMLKEHNIIGVNFNRIFPKPGVCMSSEVLKELNDEAIKTKQDKDKEQKKWTTFLQKPNRPIPKSKQQLEAEARAANAYKVKIIIPSRSPSPRPKSPEPEPPKEEEIPEPEPEPEPEEPVEDSEIPNLEGNVELILEEVNEEREEVVEEPILEEFPVAMVDEEFNPLSDITEEPTNIEEFTKEKSDKTEEELALEKQLEEVQRQLLALSTLPSTIQATLDSVTKQLAELLPAFKLQKENSKAPPASPLVEEVKVEEEPDNVEEPTSTSLRDEIDDLKKEIDQINYDYSQDATTTTTTTTKTLELKEEDSNLPEELQLKKKENDVIQELETRLKREKRSKGPRRLFGPLVPQERPLVLPGGRRWYRPKDAYNDEFIADTLSAQAELIVGHTLGQSYESPLLGFDDRVNFMKYQKPEKKIDLDKSEVYKVIHHLDRQPIRGIEVRPPVVPSAEDIQNTASAISCG